MEQRGKGIIIGFLLALCMFFLLGGTGGGSAKYQMEICPTTGHCYMVNSETGELYCWYAPPAKGNAGLVTTSVQQAEQARRPGR